MPDTMEVSPEQSSTFAGAIKSTYVNIFLQIIGKVVTFVLNALVVRYASKDLLGIVNVRLLLLHTTILFLCREGVRRACSGNLRKADWKQTVNLMWLATAASAALSVFFSLIWYFVMERPNAPFYGYGVFAYSATSTIDMLCEPLYIVAQEWMLLKVRVSAKFYSLIFQAFLNAVLIIRTPYYGIAIFSTTQILSAILYTSIFYYHFIKLLRTPPSTPHPLPVHSIRDFLPSHSKPLLPPRLIPLTWSFTKQSFLKQVLTEGERYVMSGLQMLTFAEQGIYDVVSNLGSLVARLLFQQVEENAYLFFSKVLPREKVEKDEQKQQDPQAAFGAKMLEVYLKSITALSVIIVVFGFSYSDVLLSIYGGETLNSGSAPLLMRAFWVYVLFLAVNGVTEAFVFSAMSKAEVDNYNRKLVGFTLAFLASSWVFVRWLGAVGFVVANSLNMALRIAHSVVFIRRYYAGTPHKPLKGVLVNATFFSVCASTAVFLYILRPFCNLESVGGKLVFLSFGGVLGTSVLTVLWKTENELFQFLMKLLRKKETDKSE
ncbi:hypothetical protein RvY_15287 [Ramazzottius varieornatus]|uniref:Protein RFT1 homolog n=1 Tax=Ramazzottius varieornatus TaxID=947166 RepID=A0A1D1VUE7_RAMVA|nr:hypothetical protein RvY_15287 [Ramazzottius varieornatus]